MTPSPLGGSPPPALTASDAPAADARQSQLVLVRPPAWSRPRWSLVRTHESVSDLLRVLFVLPPVAHATSVCAACPHAFESQELTPAPQVRAGAGDAAARGVMKRGARREYSG